MHKLVTTSNFLTPSISVNWKQEKSRSKSAIDEGCVKLRSQFGFLSWSSWKMRSFWRDGKADPGAMLVIRQNLQLQDFTGQLLRISGTELTSASEIQCGC